MIGGESAVPAQRQRARCTASRATRAACAGRRSSATLAAASPAYADARSTPSCCSAPRAAAGRRRPRGGRSTARAGGSRWSRKLAEPQRVLAADRLRTRCTSGRERDRLRDDARSDGSVRWRFRADGRGEGRPRDADGRLFFGDYGGSRTRSGASDGGRVWKSGTSGRRLGLSGGQLLLPRPPWPTGACTSATPTARMYSFCRATTATSPGAGDGRLRLRLPRRGAVPGVGRRSTSAPTTAVLRARRALGRVRWAPAEGRISGGAPVLGDLVFSRAAEDDATVGARTGRSSVGAARRFNPVVSDGRRIFLAGSRACSALRPPAGRRYPRAALAWPGERPPARQRRRVGRRKRLDEAGRSPAGARSAGRRAAAMPPSDGGGPPRRRSPRGGRRNVRARRQGREVCFTRDGRRVCRVPRPLVCVERSSDGRIVPAAACAEACAAPRVPSGSRFCSSHR